MNINICNDYTDTPGARYRYEGDYSGEDFREVLLEPKYLESKANHEKLLIELDGGFGYPTSFLEEAFGGLSRKYEIQDVLNVLDFVSEDEPTLIEEIRDYIRHSRDPETLRKIEKKKQERKKT